MQLLFTRSKARCSLGRAFAFFLLPRRCCWTLDERVVPFLCANQPSSDAKAATGTANAS